MLRQNQNHKKSGKKHFTYHKYDFNASKSFDLRLIILSAPNILSIFVIATYLLFIIKVGYWGFSQM